MSDTKNGKKRLSDIALKNLKAKDKPYKIADGQGLYIYVPTTGTKIWRIIYQYNGKAQTLTLGHYPMIELKEAREKLATAKRLLAKGLNPALYKTALGLNRAASDEDKSFKAVALELLTILKEDRSEGYIRGLRGLINNHLFPYLGARAVDDIEPPELLAVLRRIESHGFLTTSHKAMIFAGQVFRYAISTGKAKRDPSPDLKGALRTKATKRRAHFTRPEDIRRFLLAVDDYPSYQVVKHALQLLPLVFVRPGELQKAEWSEIDLEKAEWRIPADKMKMKRPHIVPLSRQALEILRELKALGLASRFVFPGAFNKAQSISDNTLRVALGVIGFTPDEIVPHGFRAMASTILNEQGYSPDWIEAQLAHVLGGIRAVYNHAQYLPERRQMMQDWADYLDTIKAGKSPTRG
ncbi:MAG: tyrosine-type recombinase/integrase [Deltaproteobacteria bacterium]|jgi:integrase|nr:tyrosine-type recombinase/integrase [Deltaproteobacteria bacterium]